MVPREYLEELKKFLEAYPDEVDVCRSTSILTFQNTSDQLCSSQFRGSRGWAVSDSPLNSHFTR